MLGTNRRPQSPGNLPCLLNAILEQFQAKLKALLGTVRSGMFLRVLGPLEVQQGARQALREAVVNCGRKRKLEFFLPLEQPPQKPFVVLHSLRGIG